MENLQSSLPGWEIVRCIGSGSSGKVYELKKKDEYGGDFHCALKVIKRSPLQISPEWSGVGDTRLSAARSRRLSASK